MKETYCSIPKAVLTFPVGGKTDIILRKNIEKVTKQGNSEEETYDAYECDEVQFRYNGALTVEEVENDFDSWWNYPAKASMTLDERVSALENSKADKSDVEQIYDAIAAAYQEGVQSV